MNEWKVVKLLNLFHYLYTRSWWICYFLRSCFCSCFLKNKRKIWEIGMSGWVEKEDEKIGKANFKLFNKLEYIFSFLFILFHSFIHVSFCNKILTVFSHFDGRKIWPKEKNRRENEKKGKFHRASSRKYIYRFHFHFSVFIAFISFFLRSRVFYSFIFHD